MPELVNTPTQTKLPPPDTEGGAYLR